jgi:hypothetical protein
MDKSKEIEQQLAAEKSKNTEDKIYYQKIFKALDQPPSFQFRGEFARDIICKIDQMDRISRNWLISFTILGITLTLIIAISSIVIFYGIETLLQLQYVSRWAVFIGVVMVSIQYLDAKLVRKKPMLFG